MTPVGRNIKDAGLGCIVGGAIGDAAGSSCEGVSGQAKTSSRWLTQTWSLTDDTQLTLATCEALTATRLDPAAVAERMLYWFRAKRVTGIGSTTLKALRDLAAGAHWALAGRKGDYAAGNGAAMRIAPLAFCVKPSSSQGRQFIRDVCRITHQNDEAYVGALAIAVAVVAAMDSSEPASLNKIALILPDSVVRDRLMNLASSETTMSIAEAARKTGTSGYVADSVPLALFASYQLPRLGFKEMLHQLIQVGGDTDTIASMACQVAGTALGYERLPSELIERLPERELVFSIAEAFLNKVGSSVQSF